LDEIKNDITRETPASFEPTIDYVVTKIPRFAFEKFPQADPTLNTQMKSVGEAMAIGRTFKESLQKALRSLEIGRHGLGGDGQPWRVGNEVYGDRDIFPREIISQKLISPNAERILYIRHALRAGFSIDDIFHLTKIDRWFLAQIREIVDFEEILANSKSAADAACAR
jgi:carbamoyl-phosphate synthase large subunit